MVVIPVIQKTFEDQRSHEVTYPQVLRPMVDLECKTEEIMAQKIDDALSMRNDRVGRWSWRTTLSLRKSRQFLYQKASNGQL